MPLEEQKSLLLHRSMIDETAEEKETKGTIHKSEEIHFSEGSNRDEENIAKRMMQSGGTQILNFFGTSVVDYQVPIYRVASGKSEGKVDLILSNDTSTILAELKDSDSKETLLRAMVEVRTYQLKINHYRNINDRFRRCYGHASIQPAVLIFENTQHWIDFEEMEKKPNSPLLMLAKQWDILFFRVRQIVPDADTIKQSIFAIERVL